MPKAENHKVNKCKNIFVEKNFCKKNLVEFFIAETNILLKKSFFQSFSGLNIGLTLRDVGGN